MNKLHAYPNNNLSKCLQYIHSETDVFDFNDPKTPAGYHRLGAAASYKNAPSGLDGVNFCTVEVVRPTISDTLAMTIYPYKKGINPPVWYKSGGSNEWPTLPWNVYATKSDLSAYATNAQLQSTFINISNKRYVKITANENNANYGIIFAVTSQGILCVYSENGKFTTLFESTGNRVNISASGLVTTIDCVASFTHGFILRGGSLKNMPYEIS